MQVFFPFVLAYILVAYVQGSLGSAGMLRSLRSWCWEPVAQDAYKYYSLTNSPHALPCSEEKAFCSWEIL